MLGEGNALIRHFLPPMLALFLFILTYFVRFGDRSVFAVSVSEDLWGIRQECAYTIENPEGSIDGAQNGFDGVLASCEWPDVTQESHWKYLQLQTTNLDVIIQSEVEVRFFLEGWQGQTILFQVSDSLGDHWVTLDNYDVTNPPPVELEGRIYTTTEIFTTPAQVNQAQFRFIGAGGPYFAGSLIVHLDEVRLRVNGELWPTHTPTASLPAINTSTISSPNTDIPSDTPSATDTPTLANSAPTGTLTPSPIVTSTSNISATVTHTPTRTLEPASTTTPLIDAEHTGPNSPDASQELWGTGQSCGYTINNPANSIDLSFNDLVASCTGRFAQDGREWRYTAIQDTTLSTIINSTLEIRFYMSGWVDDRIDLEVNDGGGWQRIDRFESGSSTPPSVLTTRSYNVSSIFDSTGRVNNAQVRVRGTGVNGSSDTITIFLDEVHLTVSDTPPTPTPLPPIPTPTAPTPAPTGNPSSGDPHVNTLSLSDHCTACHKSHSASGAVMRNNWPEQVVCFRCHLSTGPGTDLTIPFSYTNTATRYFRHDIDATNGVHQLGQNQGSDFGGANRHTECEDCHNPHYAARGTSNAPMLQRELTGASGVDPLWIAPGAPASYTWLTRAVREYQVCFKCHSSFTTLPTYLPDGWNRDTYVANGLRKLTSSLPSQVLDSRDLAVEFNPYQASFHPVTVMGRNQNIDAGSFVGGWSQTSLIYCTDCHQNASAASQADGPHGSPRLHILDGGANYSTVNLSSSNFVVNSQELCFKCHNYQTYVTGQNNFTIFGEHRKHMEDGGITCYSCHDTHGSEQLHLINFDAAAMTFLGGRNSQTAWYYDPARNRAGCYLDCHGKNHNPLEYTP